MDSKGDASTPSASTSDGQVSVAAAIAINIGQETALATIPDGVTIGSTTPLTVTAGGLLTLSASQTTLGTATANGSATGTGSGVAVGAGVAINLVHADTEGTIGYYHFSGSGSGPAATGAIVKSQGAALSATMSGSGTPTDTLGATAVAGAGASTVGVAGALALNYVNDTHQAEINTNSSLCGGQRQRVDDGDGHPGEYGGRDGEPVIDGHRFGLGLRVGFGLRRERRGHRCLGGAWTLSTTRPMQDWRTRRF